jgi:hypothetical protein
MTAAPEEAAGGSPACSMHEAADAYMNYAGIDEVLAFLNRLLEAERAGSRVALDTARDAGIGPIAASMQAIRRDESEWCAMLRRHIQALGAAPSPRIGEFHGKAMAIGALGPRIAFLNRGQAWVVRKLRQILPRIRADRLHADLTRMLQAHEINIARAETVMGAHLPPDAVPLQDPQDPLP